MRGYTRGTFILYMGMANYSPDLLANDCACLAFPSIIIDNAHLVYIRYSFMKKKLKNVQ